VLQCSVIVLQYRSKYSHLWSKYLLLWGWPSPV